MFNEFNNNSTSYLVALISILILVLTFRSRIANFSAYSEKSGKFTSVFVILFFGSIVLIEYFGDFVFALKGKHIPPEILSKKLFPDQYQEIIQLHFFLVMSILLSFIFLSLRDRIRLENQIETSKFSILIDRKREAAEKARKRKWSW